MAWDTATHIATLATHAHGASRNIHEPVRLGSALLRNRLALAAVTRGMAEPDGTPTAEMAAYYRRFARHRIGLIITEATYVDGPASCTYFHQPGMASRRHLDGWKRVINAVKREGGHIFLQLQHGGPFREPELGIGIGPTNRVPAVASWQRQRPYGETRKIEHGETAGLVADFAQSARWARDAGFDGVELHGSRGYLLDAFLMGDNDRDDDYGGSLANRLRFPIEVVQAVRGELGPLPLSYNLSLYKMDTVEYQPPGGVDELASTVESLADAGIDCFQASTRGLDRCRVGDVPFVDLIRRTTDRIVIGGGGIATVDHAEAVLRRGRCDIVAMARALVANPDILELPQNGSDLRPHKRGMEREPVIELASVARAAL